MNDYLKDDFIDEVKGCLGKEGDGSGQANVIESIKVNGVDQSVDSNKSVDIPVPTKTSDLDNDSGYMTEDQVNNKVTEGVASIVADAPEDFDTLKEMSDWLTKHDESAAAMNTSIKKNADDITTLQTSLSDIVSNVDYTTRDYISFKGDILLSGNRIKIKGEIIPTKDCEPWWGIMSIPFSSVLDKRLNSNQFYIDNDGNSVYCNAKLTANTSYSIDMEFKVNVTLNNRYLSLQNSILSSVQSNAILNYESTTVDLNTLTNHPLIASINTGATNTPTGFGGGYMIAVYAGTSSGALYQTLVDVLNNKTYRRKFYHGSWTDWTLTV